MRIDISSDAERDIENGYWFYESQSIGIGDYFRSSILADIDSLVIHGGSHARESLCLCASVSEIFVGILEVRSMSVPLGVSLAPRVHKCFKKKPLMNTDQRKYAIQRVDGQREFCGLVQHANRVRTKMGTGLGFPLSAPCCRITCQAGAKRRNPLCSAIHIRFDKLLTDL